MKHAIVIGAGLGGLASASLLAKRGFRVSVFEKNSTAGGKMQQIKSDSYRFDTGPSLFTMPFLLEKLFEECGESLDDLIEYKELDPICRYFYPDGVVFDNYSYRKKSAIEIEKFAPDDAKRYGDFLDYSEKLYHRAADSFIFNPLYSPGDFIKLNYKEFFKIDAFATVSDKVDEYFSSAYMRQFYKRFSTYNGSSPYKAPGTLNVIPHVELNLGGYYVKGGLYQIAESLQTIAEKLGVQFYFNQQVESIRVDRKKITGVVLENGSEESCDVLISNSDATDTFIHLLPNRSIPKRKKRKQANIEPSCSGFVFMLGCKKQWPQLLHHNIFFSSDYRKEFADIFDHKILPEDPTIYIANTSVSDPDHAPSGSSNLFILVNAPYMDDSQNWDQMIPNYKEKLINNLEERGLNGLGDSVEFAETISPPDFSRRYHSNKGSIYGTSSNSRFAAFARPRNKVKELKNLYLVGGSTHPGGGIPLVIQSAFNAVELLDRTK